MSVSPARSVPRPLHPHRWEALLPVLVAGLLAVDVLVHAMDVDEVGGNPVMPWWIADVAAVLIVLALVCLPARTAPIRWHLWLAVSALLVSTAILVLPYDLLLVVMEVIKAVSGGEDLFDVATPWLLTSRHLLVVAVAGCAWQAAIAARRDARAACRNCGRIEPRRPSSRSGLLAPACVLAALAPWPYIWLKFSWGTGSDVGLADPGYFDDVTLSTPGFGDTAALGALGVLAAALMAFLPRPAIVRWLLVAIGVTGALMLLPVGVIGSFMVVLAATGLVDPPGFDVIKEWAFGIVYGSFLLWGAGLAAATLLYWRGTRSGCTAHQEHSHA